MPINISHLTVPGKLFIAGEYAITNPHCQAIIAAINRGISVHIAKTAKSSSHIVSDTVEESLIGPLHTLTQAAVPYEWRFVGAAIETYLSYVGEAHHKTTLSQVIIRLSSDLTQHGYKIGLGSSAAVVVAIINALDVCFDNQFSADIRFKLAAIAHFNVQKAGSLGDVAAAVYGGLIHYQSPNTRLMLAASNANHLSPEWVDREWPNLKITTLAWPQDWQLTLLPTETPANTSQALALVDLSQPFLTESRFVVTRATEALNTANYADLRKALADNQELLRNELPEGYITPELSEQLAYITQQQLAGKISGAGFGDNAFVITDSRMAAPETPATAVPLTIAYPAAQRN